MTGWEGTESDLLSQLGQDVPGVYLVWAAAIIAIGAVGYVPGTDTSIVPGAGTESAEQYIEDYR